MIIIDLIRCSHEPNISVPQLASLLLDRSQCSPWVVVYKALLTTHTLMNYGNEVIFIVLALFSSGLVSCDSFKVGFILFIYSIVFHCFGVSKQKAYPVMHWRFSLNCKEIVEFYWGSHMLVWNIHIWVMLTATDKSGIWKVNMMNISNDT